MDQTQNSITEKDDEMVMCSNYACEARWFHLQCVNLATPPPPEEDFYCSQACRDSATYMYIYCTCHKKLMDKRMAQCFLEDRCLRYEWYHLCCLGMEEDAVLPGYYILYISY